MIRFNLIDKLKIIFNFKKSKTNRRTSGIVTEGKNATFVNCEGSGPDAGIIDKGKNTTAINSNFTSTGKK